MPFAPGATQQITVGNSQYSAVIAASPCRSVVIGEDPSVAGYPTTDFLIARPTASAQPRRIPGGSGYKIDSQSLFKQGDTVAFVKTVTGTTTFFQDEI